MFKWKNKKIGEGTENVKKLKSNLPAYLVLSLAVVAMTFFGVCTPDGARVSGPSGVAAKVGSVDISALDFRRAHIAQSQQYQQQFQGNFDPVAMRLSEQVVDQLVKQEVLFQAASENGVMASDLEVEKVILDGQYFQDENGRFSSEQFKTYLRSQGFSEKSFSEYLKRSIVQSKLRNFVTATFATSKKSTEIDYLLSETKLAVSFIKIDNSNVPLDISSEQVAEFLADEKNLEKVRTTFESRSADYNQPKQVRARHILIGFEGARRASGEASSRSKEEASKLAFEVSAQAKQGKVKFADLAARYTDEPGGAEKGGDLGFFKKETMVEAFSEAAFAMKKGDISEPVETPFGFHVIKVEEIKDALSISFESAQKEIAENLIRQEEAPKMLEDRAQKILAAAQAGDDLSSLGVSWQQTGSFALNARSLPAGLGTDPELMSAVRQMRQVGKVSEQVIKAGGSRYVLRLDARQLADLSKLSEEKKEELQNSNRFMQAFWLYNGLTSSLEEKYEKDGKIYRNPSFLRYDELMQAG